MLRFDISHVHGTPIFSFKFQSLLIHSLGMPCPRKFNPADHYIMKISVIPGNEQSSKDKIAEIADQYESSENKLSIDSKIDEVIENEYESPDVSRPYRW